MAGMNPIGEFFQAREGGLHQPLDRTAFDRIQAQAAAGTGEAMEVTGVGYRYGTVGWFGMYGAIRIEAGAFIEAPGKHRKYRDAMGLYSHNTADVLARVGNNTMDITYGENEITYAMRLNKKDSLAQDVWARLMREDINASSIGFIIVEGDWTEGYDNSLDADSEKAGEKIEIFSVTKAELIEVSLVAQGAYAGATSSPAGRQVSETLDAQLAEVAGDIVTGGETIDHEVKNALPVQSAMLTVDDITEADLEPEEPDASADQSGGGEGDDGGDGGSVDGGAEPDGLGDPSEERGEGDAAAEAEAQGMTLKDIVGRAPADLKWRLTDVN